MMFNCKSAQATFQRISQLEKDRKTTAPHTETPQTAQK
jgi:hypothetical protein